MTFITPRWISSESTLTRSMWMLLQRSRAPVHVTFSLNNISLSTNNISKSKLKDDKLSYRHMNRLCYWRLYSPSWHTKGSLSSQLLSIQVLSCVVTLTFAQHLLSASPSCQFLNEEVLWSDHTHESLNRPIQAFLSFVVQFCLMRFIISLFSLSFLTLARSVWYSLQYLWASCHFFFTGVLLFSTRMNVLLLSGKHWSDIDYFMLKKMFMDVNSDEMITHSSTHRCSRWRGAHQYSGHRATVRPQTYKRSLHYYHCCSVVHFSILDTVTETSGLPETISKHRCLSCAAQSKHIQCVCWQCLWCPAGHSCCWRWSDPCDSVCSISELRSTTSMCSQSDTDAENPPRNREPLTLGEKHRQFTVSKV